MKQIFLNIFLQKNKQYNSVGKLFEKNYNTIFEYESDYILNNFPNINPATLNYKKNGILFESNKINKTFIELIPHKDDWAHQVIVSKYSDYEYFTDIEKLLFLSNRNIGGLSYSTKNFDEKNINDIELLDLINQESILLYYKKISSISSVKNIEPLINYSGSRPKCMFEDSEGNHWVAKFNLPEDDIDNSINEHIALELGKINGLNCCDSKILKLPSGESVFLSKRFDRNKEKIFFSIPVSALFEDNVNEKKSLLFIYKKILENTELEQYDQEQLIKKFLFDIAINNTDNHLKNMRLMLDENDKWRLAPFYDINFSSPSMQQIYRLDNIPHNSCFLTDKDFVNNFANLFNIEKSKIQEIVYGILKSLISLKEIFDKNNLKNYEKQYILSSIFYGTKRKEFNSSYGIKYKK